MHPELRFYEDVLSNDGEAVGIELLELLHRCAQHVRVQAAAKPFVGRDNDDACRLRPLVRHHERVTILGVRAAHVRSDVANLFGIRPYWRRWQRVSLPF